MHLDLSSFEFTRVSRVHHEHDSVILSAVPFPHNTEFFLPSQIPDLYSNFSFGNFVHIKSDGWNHIWNFFCPPRSQTFIATFPLVTLYILNPTVGIISGTNVPRCKTRMKVLFPAFSQPTIEISISCCQNFVNQDQRPPMLYTNIRK